MAKFLKVKYEVKLNFFSRYGAGWGGREGGSVAFHGVEDPDMAHFLKNTFLK